MTRRRLAVLVGVLLLALAVAWFVPIPTRIKTIPLVEPYSVALIRYRSLVRRMTVELPHSPAPRWGMDYGTSTVLMKDGRRLVRVSDLRTVRVRDDALRYAYIPPSADARWTLRVVDVPTGESVELPLERWYSSMIWKCPDTLTLGFWQSGDRELHRARLRRV